MRNFLIALALIFVGATAANAQDYKPFKLGFGLGYAVPSDGGGGILVALEPAYRVNDDIAVGLRMETAVMARGIESQEASASGNGSYTINGQYYLGSSNVRPYVGLGLGIFTVAALDFGDGEVGGGSKFGFYPRVGLDIGHFNINLDYNIISAIKESYDLGGGNTMEVNMKTSYMGIRVGAYLFGGKN